MRSSLAFAAASLSSLRAAEMVMAQTGQGIKIGPGVKDYAKIARVAKMSKDYSQAPNTGTSRCKRLSRYAG